MQQPDNTDTDDDSTDYLCPTGTFYIGPDFQINYCCEWKEETELDRLRQVVDDCHAKSVQCVQLYNRVAGCVATYPKAVPWFAAEVQVLYRDILAGQKKVREVCSRGVEGGEGEEGNEEEVKAKAKEWCREVACSVSAAKAVFDDIREVAAAVAKAKK